MAYPQWPAQLPKPLRKPFRVRGKPPVQRTKMESGPDRTQRISATIMREAPVTVVIPESDQQAFWDFYDNDANAGANWVEMPLRIGNTVALHRCKIKTYPDSKRVAPDADEFSFMVETDQRVMS